MASQLNSYCNFIDICTKEGQALVSNAIDKFSSPLVGEDCISLIGSNFQKLKDNINCLGSCYEYHYLFKPCVTVQVFIPEVLADAYNSIVAAPEQLFYKNPINMLEKYFDSNIELAQKHALLTWGDCSFTLQPNTIAKLTEANGLIDATDNLKEEEKELVLEQMHSKFLCHHLLKLFTDSACQAIAQQSSIYTWISHSGNKEEVDGLTILALILARICPNFKVVMYAEITKVIT
jgi:hypothetical protein